MKSWEEKFNSEMKIEIGNRLILMLVFLTYTVKEFQSTE